MKILYGVHQYPPYIGGTEEVSRQICEHLAALGHLVTVATASHPARPPSAGNGVVVEPFDLSSRAVWPDHPRASREEALRYRALFDGDWDVRFIYGAQTWPLNVVWDLVGEGDAADILAPCGYSWLRSSGLAHALRRNPPVTPYFQLIERILPRFHSVVYHSTVYQDYRFAEERDLLANAAVIPNGTELPDERRPPIAQGEHEPAALCTVGSHVRSKGHADFLSVCKALGLPGLLVAPRPVALQTRARGCYYWCRLATARSANVELIEGSNRAAVHDAMTRSHIFFLPSAVETAPLVILEAMARGLPWVSYEVGMVKTLPGGIVVADPDEARRTLQSLAGNAALRRELAEAGRAAIDSGLTWDRILPRYQTLLETVSKN